MRAAVKNTYDEFKSCNTKPVQSRLRNRGSSVSPGIANFRSAHQSTLALVHQLHSPSTLCTGTFCQECLDLTFHPGLKSRLRMSGVTLLHPLSPLRGML